MCPLGLTIKVNCGLLTIAWVSSIKYVHCSPRLHAWVDLLAGVWPACHATLLFLVVIGNVTMKNELHGFLFTCFVCGSGAPFGSPPGHQVLL